jgi:hypothetical protein
MKGFIGQWGFIIGLVIAVLMGLFNVFDNQWVAIVLVVLGLIVGLMNVTSRESTGFLIAAIALIVGGTGFLNVFQGLFPGVQLLQSILSAIVVFVAAAAFPVVFRVLFGTLRDRRA